MIKTILLGLLVLILGVIIYAGLSLRQAHEDIDSLNPDLPSWSEIRRSRRGIEVLTFPTSIEAKLVSSQIVSVSDVLEGGDAEQAFDMAFPSFVITWLDGKQFVVDAGMTELTAEAFGAPFEALGAAPMVFEDRLRDLVDFENVEGLGFTHLHEDHTEGMSDLCSAESKRKIQVVQTIEQFTRTNYATEAGNVAIDNLDCGQRFIIKDKSLLKPVSGFPGLYVIYAAGHTPGSQIFLVNVREGLSIKTYLIAGDLANHFDGIINNTPKPSLYSLLITPENLEQLDKLRIWLKSMNDEENVQVLISHDRSHLESVFY